MPAERENRDVRPDGSGCDDSQVSLFRRKKLRDMSAVTGCILSACVGLSHRRSSGRSVFHRAYGFPFPVWPWTTGRGITVFCAHKHRRSCAQTVMVLRIATNVVWPDAKCCRGETWDIPKFFFCRERKKCVKVWRIDRETVILHPKRKEDWLLSSTE